MEIVQLALAHLPLKPNGADYEGKCPNCGKNGFKISKIKQVFLCFDCGIAGDAAILRDSALAGFPKRAEGSDADKPFLPL